MSRPLHARVRCLGFILALGLTPAGACDWGEAEAPTYTVVRGDTLTRIARVHGCTVAELRAWNGLDGDLIEVGQVLVVGADAGAASRAPGPASGQRERTRNAPPTRAAAPASRDVGLRLPVEQACLKGPDEVEEEGMEAGFAASRGLDGAQVSAALTTFEPNLVRCLRAGDGVAGTADLELTVACTGRVASVTLVDDGGLPAELVACVRDTLRYAAFPAHDMPDGFTFGYPVTVGP